MSSNLPYSRPDRLADLIHQLASEALLSDLADPRLKGVSITYVRVTKDMRLARINFHIADATEKQKKDAQKGLGSAKGYLKRKIAAEISLKFMPDLEFYYDDGFDAGERVEEILEGLGASSRQRREESL